MNNNNFVITFWGVRGSCPTPGPETVQYGGNTPCVQIVIDNKLLILDAGTGIRNLGNELEVQSSKVTADIFITHTHWDHIQGFPFFKPLYKKGNYFNIYGCENIDKLLIHQLQKTFFPVQFDQIKSELKFTYLQENDLIQINKKLKVRVLRSNHIGVNFAYRIESRGKACCYLTDMEHSEADKHKLIDFIKKSDMVIYDAKYTDKEYCNGKKGWGHSTWQEGIKLVKAARAKKLILFHHAPHRNDKELEEIEKKAKLVYPDTQAAREGMVISL